MRIKKLLLKTNYNLLHNLNFYIVLVSLIAYLICIFSQRHFVTGDTHRYQILWWNYINENGFKSIATLNNSVSTGGLGGDYTTIWYFIIWIFCKIGLYPNFPVEYNIKLIAVVASVVSAIVVYFIIKHFRSKARYAPTFGMVVTLFLPAFLLDVIKTNLPDTVYLMFILFAFLTFIKDKKQLAWFVLGLGLCFKLMAIYLAPFFLYFYLKDFKKYRLKDKLSPLFIFPAIIICSIPCVISGGSWFDGILGVFINRSVGAMHVNGYTLWQLMPNDIDNFKYFSIALMFLVFVAIFIFVKYFVSEENKADVEYTILLPLFPMIAYFLLPAQHETYFAMATVFAFINWCIIPRRKTLFIFATTNMLLFIGYSIISFRWFLEEMPNSNSILYDSQLWALCTASIIAYLMYQLYKSSIYNKK